jgi:uncharacterized lipoprotein YmbA
LGAAVLLMTAGGCLNLNKPTVIARHFVLAATEGAPAPATGRAAGLALGIAPVQVAGYLHNKNVAVRRGQHELVLLSQALGSEPLDEGILRVITSNLAARLHTERILVEAWTRVAVALELYLSVHSLDLASDGTAVLDAFWHLTRPGGGPPLHHGAASLTMQGPSPGEDMDGAVGSLSALLGQLSQRIAQDIEALP